MSTRHHTKDKGDSGLGFVIADLLSKGIQVALPISEHLSFDCIAISMKNKLCRVSVKYRSLNSRGAIEVRLKSSWADKHGTHYRKHDMKAYDATAIYCPETKKCYYVRNNEVKRASIWLKSGLGKFCDPNRLFEPT